MSCVMGIDLGTQSLKVLVYDAALRHCIKALDSRIIQQLTAIGVTGQQQGFVALDDDGAALVTVKLWCDTATANQTTAIAERASGANECIRHEDNPIAVGYTASKIACLKDHHPTKYARLDTVRLPHDYLNFMLTGRRCREPGDASSNGLMDIRTRCCSTRLLLPNPTRVEAYHQHYRACYRAVRSVADCHQNPSP